MWSVRAQPLLVLAPAGSGTGTGTSPRIFVYDLDVLWRMGPQLAAEFDMEVTERTCSWVTGRYMEMETAVRTR